LAAHCVYAEEVGRLDVSVQLAMQFSCMNVASPFEIALPGHGMFDGAQN
jgi:hypothetical protein